MKLEEEISCGEIRLSEPRSTTLDTEGCLRQSVWSMLIITLLFGTEKIILNGALIIIV